MHTVLLRIEHAAMLEMKLRKTIIYQLTHSQNHQKKKRKLLSKFKMIKIKRRAHTLVLHYQLNKDGILKLTLLRNQEMRPNVVH